MRDLLQELAAEAWNEQQRVDRHGADYLVRAAIPILYFGDSQLYRQSPLRVITVGLNPSREEFPRNAPFSRFARPLNSETTNHRGPLALIIENACPGERSQTPIRLSPARFATQSDLLGTHQPRSGPPFGSRQLAAVSGRMPSSALPSRSFSASRPWRDCRLIQNRPDVPKNAAGARRYRR
jgi:hypothetical protein